MSKSFFDYFPPPKFLELPFVGLNISSKAVRVLELTHKNGLFTVSRFGERMLSEPIANSENLQSNAELKKILESLQREFKLRYVKVTLPEQEAYLFKTEVETGTDEEMRTAIEFHLEENVPISGEEAVFDYHIFKKKDSTHLEVSVTVLPKKIIETYTELLESCSLQPLSFHLEPTAVSRAVIKYSDLNTYLIVNLGETKTGISIASNGAIQFTSTVEIGSESFTSSIARQFKVSPEEAEKIKKEKGFTRQEENSDLFFALANSVSVLKDEIERVYMYWHSHGNKEGTEGRKIEKIILTGKDSSLVGFKDHLSLSLKVPVELGNVWTNLFTFEEAIPPISLVESLNYAACIGLILPKIK